MDNQHFRQFLDDCRFQFSVFLSYGLIYKTGFSFYLTFPVTIVFMCLITSALSSILVLFGAKILPAGRIRTIIIVLGVFMTLLLILVLRLIRPEQLVNPDSFASVVLYLNSMQTPDSPLLPTTWITDIIKASLNGEIKTVFLTLHLPEHVPLCSFL